MLDALRWSKHAQLRQAQRNLSDEDIWFVLENGQQFYCAGVLCVFLGRRDIPNEKFVYQRFAHLEGTLLKLATDDHSRKLTLVTAYRNRRAGRRMRAKQKYDMRSCRHN